MALKIYRKDSTPSVLTFTLPGLVLENTSSDPGQGPGLNVLTEDVLTNWLHDSAHLDLAQPQMKADARQIMEAFQPYYDKGPESWQKFADQAKGKLQGFDLGEVKMNFGQGGIFGLLFFAWIGYAGMCISVFLFLALCVLKRTFARARDEIESGQWTPPNPAPLRLTLSNSDMLSVALFLLALAAVYLVAQSVPFVGVFLLLGILLIGTRQLTSRLQIQKAREGGLWPQSGELPTLEHVKHLAQAGEKILAIKLYRQIHGVPLADAKAAVEKLAGHSTPPLHAEGPPKAALQWYQVSKRVSKLALWIIVVLFFLIVGILLMR
jgi:hypothetical protein